MHSIMRNFAKSIIYIMCETALISKNLVRMGKRTYLHRMEVATPNTYRVGQLARLNRDLDSLYEMLYAQWRSVTAEDYKVFGGQFQVLLDIIKALYDSCRKLPREMGLKDETRKLGMNYSALYEINSDIVNFALKSFKRDKIKAALLHLATVDKRLAENELL